MAGILPSCFKVDFNCVSINISQEVQLAWDRFDPSTSVKLHILHCPSIEIPKSFQRFRRLTEIWVYNSTIVEWGAEAAITSTHHPDMAMVSMVRINMTGGSLPLGFQSLEFPLSLLDINFCETNLRTLPDDLDTKWHIDSSILLENSEFTEVPPVLMRLQPSPGMIDITNTNISSFWSWVDPLVKNTQGIMIPIIAGGSRYCAERESIMNGDIDTFSEPFHPGESSLLMNASKGIGMFCLLVWIVPPQPR
ncbi:unnamed protein product [Phytophthora lilii]|uniref:Unnamed protein product n=1 Tax=Phytophthora lilii TaxID=2077276 RepID=A0A9W6WLL1_9STRA|nr:unnamed protein product [Phytophthora lilii]